MLALTLKHRANTYQMLGLQPLSVDDQKQLLDQTNGKLLSLIWLMIFIENPSAPETIMTYNNRLLLVCFTERADAIRIFSARRATKEERKDYKKAPKH